MRTGISWIAIGAACAISWLLALGFAENPSSPSASHVAAAIATSVVVVTIAAWLLQQRDIPVIALSSAAGTAVGVSATWFSNFTGISLSLSAVGVFIGAAVAAAIVASAVQAVKYKRKQPNHQR